MFQKTFQMVAIVSATLLSTLPNDLRAQGYDYCANGRAEYDSKYLKEHNPSPKNDCPNPFSPCGLGVLAMKQTCPIENVHQCDISLDKALSRCADVFSLEEYSFLCKKQQKICAHCAVEMANKCKCFFAY